VALLSAAHFKRADYLLPAYPGAAIFLGCWLEQQLAQRWRRLVLAGVVATAAVMLAGWTYRIGWSLTEEERYRDYRPFAAIIREHAASQPVIFFRTEAHTLAFRVGQPLVQMVEWSKLRDRLAAPGPHWIVVPAKVVAQTRAKLAQVDLDEVCRITDLAGGSHERPLVLLRGTMRTPHADHSATAAHDRPADQRRAAVP
jgi:hypothetical protein